MSERFVVDARGEIFRDLDQPQIIFHGIDKSGSRSLAEVIGEGLSHVGRDHEYVCHYGSKLTQDEFIAKVDAVRGSSFVAAHRLYGSLKPRPNRIWITLFRHPLPRVVSAYSWLQKKHVRTHGTTDGFPLLEEFIIRGQGLAHSQIAQFSVNTSLFAKNRSRLNARDLFEISVDAIEREFYAIGISEKFEETIFTVSKLCGIDSVSALPKDDRNEKRPLAETLPATTRDLIEEYYKWDWALYRYALERFDRQTDGISFGPSVEAYKKACQDQHKDMLTL